MGWCLQHSSKQQEPQWQAQTARAHRPPIARASLTCTSSQHILLHTLCRRRGRQPAFAGGAGSSSGRCSSRGASRTAEPLAPGPGYRVAAQRPALMITGALGSLHGLELQQGLALIVLPISITRDSRFGVTATIGSCPLNWCSPAMAQGLGGNPAFRFAWNRFWATAALWV